MKSENQRHFWVEIFIGISSVVSCVVVLTIFMFLYNYIGHQKEFKEYSLSVTSEFVNERLANYRTKMMSLFGINNINYFIEYSNNKSQDNLKKIQLSLKNIYSENTGMQFVYCLIDGEILSVGEGIGSVEARYKIFDEYKKEKEEFANEFYWKYLLDDKGRGCIIFCKDIVFLNDCYEKKQIATMCVGVNIDEINNEFFYTLKTVDTIMCNQFVVDSYGTIFLATNEQFIGKKEIDVLKKDGINDAFVTDGVDYKIVTYINDSFISFNYVQLLIILAFFILFIVGIVYLMLRISKQLTKPIDELYDYINSIDIDSFDKIVKCQKSGKNISELVNLEDKFDLLIEKLYRKVNEQYELQTELKNTQLKMYESQMNPHFLFNSLSAVQMMMVLDEKENAIRAISYLGDILEFYLENSSEVMMEAELDNAETYMKMLKLRYKDKFEYDMDVDESVKNCVSMKFLIQPFIENSIKHGFKNKLDNWEITVLAEHLFDDVVIIVEDNGYVDDADIFNKINKTLENDVSAEKLGKGIWNINSIIRLKYGEKYGVTMNRSANKTQAIIHIPYIFFSDGGKENV